MELALYIPPVVPIVAQHSVHIGGMVNKAFLVHQNGRGTGKILWPAAELLSTYLAQPTTNKTIAVAAGYDSWSWEHKTVLELGAGMGLLATTLLCLGATVIATDGEVSVVEQLNKNVLLNSPKVLDVYDALKYDGMIYGWGTDIFPLTEALGQLISKDAFITEEISPSFNVIIASDVVYGSDMSIWDKLLKTLVDLTKLTEDKVLILIAQTERYKDSEDMFYARAAEVLNFVEVLDLSGYASSCLHAGMKSTTRLYVYTSPALTPS